MPPIKPIEKIARKWATVTPQRTADYVDGIQNPGKDWATATIAAESSYEDGIRAAIAENRFSAGVKKAGTQKWQEKALALGPSRWGQGVTQAEGDYRAGFAPIRDAIERTTLPPRFARGDPRNLLRVTAMAQAIGEAAKRARLG